MNTMTTTESPGEVISCLCGNRYKKITDNLYECLTYDISCSNKFPFGTRYFCSWLMYPGKDRTEQNFPCLNDAPADKTL